MPIVCTCQAVTACGVNCGGSTDLGCASHTPTFFRTITNIEKINIKDLVLTISGVVGGLRNWVTNEYTRRNLSVGTWTEPTLTAESSITKIEHFTEIDAKLNAITLCRCNCNKGVSGGCTCNSNNYANYYKT